MVPVNFRDLDDGCYERLKHLVASRRRPEDDENEHAIRSDCPRLAEVVDALGIAIADTQVPSISLWALVLALNELATPLEEAHLIRP